jgi:hypothetical protein
VRQLENDWDRLVEAWAGAGGGPKEEAMLREALGGDLAALAGELDEVRGAYATRPVARTVEALDRLVRRIDEVGERIAALDVSRRVSRAWEQVAIDLRRLRQVRVAVAEIEDLSDELKRFLLRTDEEAAASDLDAIRSHRFDAAAHVVAQQGRLEAAVLEFEEAADALKTAYRKSPDRRPKGLRRDVETLARTARTIDFTVADASTPAEVRREWEELVPFLRVVLESHGWSGIGQGWETHR